MADKQMYYTSLNQVPAGMASNYTQQSIPRQTANKQSAQQQGTTMGSVVFSGENAFPSATQAAFGGQGGMGIGIGYGGNSEGASIIIPAGALYQQPAPAVAPSGSSGMASDPVGLVLVVGMVLAVVLIIGVIGNRR